MSEMLVFRENCHSMLVMKSCGFSFLCSLSPLKSVALSDMVLSSLSSGSEGVVHAENCGVEGGAADEDWGLVEVGLVDNGLIDIGLDVLGVDGREKEGADGIMKEDSAEDSAVVRVFGSYLPLSSHCMTFANVVSVRLPHGR
jgi:hypothetical protein